MQSSPLINFIADRAVMYMNKRVYSVRHKRIEIALLWTLFGLLSLATVSMLFGGDNVLIFLWIYMIVLIPVLDFHVGIIWYLLSILFFNHEAFGSIICFLNDSQVMDGVSAVLDMVGIVSFALSYINAARTRNVHGILFEDVIHAFFPYYKIIFVASGVLICLGRFACSVGNGITGLLCLVGTIISLIYILKMTNTVVFTEKKIRSLTDEYISLIASEYLGGRLNGTGNAGVTNFIKSVGSYVAHQYSSTDFSISYASRTHTLVALISLLRCDTDVQPQSLAKSDASKALKTFETGSPDDMLDIALGDTKELAHDICYQCCVARLPYAKWVWESAHHEMQLACSFWHSMLDNGIEENVRTRLICEVLCIEYEKKLGVSGFLGTGLLLYIHSVYISDISPEKEDGWLRYRDVLFDMYRMATDGTVERNDILMKKDNSLQDWLRKKCIELMLILEAWSFLEQCRSTLRFETKCLRRTIEVVLDAEKRIETSYNISDKALRLHVYNAVLLYDMLPNTSLPPALLGERCNHFNLVWHAMVEIRDQFLI